MDNTMTYTMSYQLPPTVACAAGCVLQWQVRDTWAAGRATTRACWRLMYIYNTPLGLYALLSLMIHTQARVRIQHHIRTMLRRAADMSLAVEPHMPLPTLVWGQHTHNCVFLPPLPPPPGAVLCHAELHRARLQPRLLRRVCARHQRGVWLSPWLLWHLCGASRVLFQWR